MKILLNAESFGFGPSAAISSIFPIIREYSHTSKLDYIGNGLSLDLQKKLPYNNIYVANTKQEFDSVVSDYDIFITAMDYEKAGWAQEYGIPTIIYDALLWYWKKIPTSIYSADLVIAQDFFEVKEKIKNLNLKNVKCVPPLISIKPPPVKLEESIILINFGGLENPYWTSDITFEYIENILRLVIPELVKRQTPIKIVCSKKNVDKFIDKYGEASYNGHSVENVCFYEMQNYMGTAKLVLATPGLGNIYECAKFEVPSLFLPPMNDSQGLQLSILSEKGIIDSKLNWGANINYRDNQHTVMLKIEKEIKMLKSYSYDKISNVDLLINEALSSKGNKKLRNLLNLFGLNGLDVTKSILLEKLDAIRNT